MSEFWRDRKVVITGGAGLIGSHLCELLIREEAQVWVLDDYSRGTNYVQGVHRYSEDLDAGNPLHCQQFFEGAFCVFNLAGVVGGVYFNLAGQAPQFWENVRLQTVPAMVAAQMDIPIFLQTSSVCVYATGYNNPALEENGHLGEPERANAGYAWAKRLGERVCSWAFAGKPTRYTIVRPTNAYGERDYYDDKAHVIPALVQKFAKGNHTVYGGPQTREFIHAEDVARGMMTVARYGVCGEAYNLGTNGETQVTISYLARTIRRFMGLDEEVELVDAMPTGDEHRCTNSRKALSLGWKYRISLEKGLERVIHSYQGTA